MKNVGVGVGVRVQNRDLVREPKQKSAVPYLFLRVAALLIPCSFHHLLHQDIALLSNTLETVRRPTYDRREEGFVKSSQQNKSGRET